MNVDQLQFQVSYDLGVEFVEGLDQYQFHTHR